MEKATTLADCSPSLAVTSLTATLSSTTRRCTSKLQRPVLVGYRAWISAKSGLPVMRSPEQGQSITQSSARWLAARVQSLAFIAFQNDSMTSRPIMRARICDSGLPKRSRAHHGPDSALRKPNPQRHTQGPEQGLRSRAAPWVRRKGGSVMCAGQGTPDETSGALASARDQASEPPALRLSQWTSGESPDHRPA